MSDFFTLSFHEFTPRAKYYLDKAIDFKVKHLKSTERKQQLTRFINQCYYPKYRRCIHFLYSNQDSFISAVINGVPYNKMLNLVESKMCIDCTVKLFVKSDRLKYFMAKLKELGNNNSFKIEEIGNDHQFISYGISFLLLLQNPLILRYIIYVSNKNPYILRQLFVCIYFYYSKWLKVLKPKKWPYEIKDMKSKRHKYVSYWTLRAIDHHTSCALVSLIYKLNKKLLKYFMFDLRNGAFFKKYAYDIWHKTMKEGSLHMVPMTHGVMLYVSLMWWKKIFRNQSHILNILQSVYGTHVNIDKYSKWHIIQTQNEQYPYFAELFELLANNPENDNDPTDTNYNMNYYKSTYLKQHELYTICGNKKCQIGYFEHKYGEAYFDAFQLQSDWVFDDHNLVAMMKKLEHNEYNPRPFFVWKLPAIRKWYLCKKCKMVYYCSKKCQKIDWNLYNHRKFCSLKQNF
eukprot:502629_1